MDHPGLLSWANSICLTMASDPGRQVFKDQVHTHGFMFLEDYLDNIVSGGKADPLIELVKTPGRKKAIARKPKLMSSKLANSVLTEENENMAPINSFQIALEKVTIAIGSSDSQKVSGTISEESVFDRGHRLPFTLIQPVKTTTTALSDSSTSLRAVVINTALEPIPHVNIDLSVIAEDDEPSERSRISATSSAVVKVISPKKVQKIYEDPAFPPVLEPITAILPSASSMMSTLSAETFESIVLSSPEQTAVCPRTATEATFSEETKSAPEFMPTKPSSHVLDYPMTDTQDYTVFIDRKSTDRPAPPSFPALPGPMPLRKSMRLPRDPSLNTVMLGAATPGAAVGGKRTSWLAKAREVKALEAPTKKQTIAPSNINSNIGASSSHGFKRKSEDMLSMPSLSPEDDESQPKTPKLCEGDTASRRAESIQSDKPEDQALTTLIQQTQYIDDLQEGVLDRLKKTVEGLGFRSGKTMSKSVGGGAVSALAEARAAAEAKIAERDRKEDEITTATALSSVKDEDLARHQDIKMETSMGRNGEGRLSISELFPIEGRMKEKHTASERPFQFTPSFVPTSTKKGKEIADTRERISGTPLHSPQSKGQPFPSSPVFNKPPPVFVPPSSTTSLFTHHPVFNAPPSPPKYTMPPSIALGFSPRPLAPSSKLHAVMPLTAQSTLESVQSDIFDDDDDFPAWVPSTQDTEYTSSYDSQSQLQGTQICDEDDSWPVDDKLAAGVQWTFGAKDDSMTWSTLPSQSQRAADTGPMTRVSPIPEKDSAHGSQQIPELQDIILGPSKPAATVVEKIPRSQSQISMASSESSQSQTGFFGQTSKLFSGLGVKKKQPEVKKVLQLAATAAKKQQEEADKKAARLKEMDNRRQLALQRKAEEEKSKALEEERKMKEDIERRKKERDDLTDKRSIKASSSKRDDEGNKKRKIEPEKKQELKKPGPSMLVGKSHSKTALKQPSTTNLNNPFGFGSANPSTIPLAAEGSSSSQKEKSVAHPPIIIDDEVSQPSQLVHSQMAARAKAQLDAAKPHIASESIELPDINSEYSDSEDEDRPRTFDPPEWAQSPELRQALEMQSTINPDDIFGAVRPIKMEEIFKTRTSRFRPRSSSANWTGTDRLTLQEEKDYARRMGFK